MRVLRNPIKKGLLISVLEYDRRRDAPFLLQNHDLDNNRTLIEAFKLVGRIVPLPTFMLDMHSSLIKRDWYRLAVSSQRHFCEA